METAWSWLTLTLSHPARKCVRLLSGVIPKLSPVRFIGDEGMVLIVLVTHDDRFPQSVTDQSQKAQQLVECRLRRDLTRRDVELNHSGREKMTRHHNPA